MLASECHESQLEGFSGSSWNSLPGFDHSFGPSYNQGGWYPTDTGSFQHVAYFEPSSPGSIRRDSLWQHTPPPSPPHKRKRAGGRAMSNAYDGYTPSTTALDHTGYSHVSQALDQKYTPARTQAHNKSQITNVVASRSDSRAPSPVQFEKAIPPEQQRNKYSSHHAIAAYLRLPIEISNGRKGSLAEFTAEITCLFWFESAVTLASIENSLRCPTPPTKLAQDAIPTTGFLKWVTTILTTTQVSTSVVLLALLFIFRLKTQNPQVNGKSGSEYRLLTVALMLGNKFLDDNTYTNKTWAEVSGIDVKEIHVMEVEFLSHMKYNLYTSKEQWKDWFQHLNKFWTYHELASRKLNDIYARASVQRPPILQIPWALPSPPASSTESPPYASAASPETSIPPPLSALPPYMAANTVSPATSISDYEPSASSSTRKRSWEQVAQETPEKRQHVAPPPRHRTPRLNTNHATSQALPSIQSLPIAQQPPMPISQPRPYRPLESYTPQEMPGYPSSGRSTPSTYLPPANWLHGLPQPAAMSQRPTNAMAYALSSAQGSAYPSRHQTPTASFQAMNPFEGQAQYSPSHYLEKRTSPYRPVRHMSQLTQAPPSRDMYEYPAQVSHDQIQWQPLKKNVDDNERRTGRVPYYHDPYAWPLPPYDTTQYNTYPGMPGGLQ